MKMTPEMVQRANDYLFASVEEMREAGIQERIIERLLRIRAIYTYWLNRPQLNDRDIVAEMVKRYKLATRTAYDDLALIKTVLGSLNQCSQDYLRWVFLQRCEEGFEMARKKDDPSAFAKVLTAYGKYSRLDREEGLAPDYSAIVPQVFEISSNPEDAGFKRIPDIEKKADKMLKQFQREFQSVEFEEIKMPKQP